MKVVQLSNRAGKSFRSASVSVRDFDPDWCRSARPERCPDCNNRELQRETCTNCGGQGVIIKPLVILLLLCFSFFMSAAEPFLYDVTGVACNMFNGGTNQTYAFATVTCASDDNTMGGVVATMLTGSYVGATWDAHSINATTLRIHHGDGWPTVTISAGQYTVGVWYHSFTFTISNIRAKPIYCTVTCGVNNPLWGSISPSGQVGNVLVTSSFSFSATGNLNHDFLKFVIVDSIGTEEVTDDSSSWVVRGNTTITAYFLDFGQSSIEYSVYADPGGTTDPNGWFSCLSGDSIIVNALPDEGFNFYRWRVSIADGDGDYYYVYAYSNPYTRTVNVSTNFVAYFLEGDDPGSGSIGMITNDGTFDSDDDVPAINALSLAVCSKLDLVIGNPEEISEKLEGEAGDSPTASPGELTEHEILEPEIQDRSELNIEVHQYQELKNIIDTLPSRFSDGYVPIIQFPLHSIGLNTSFGLSFNDGPVGSLRLVFRYAFSIVFALLTVFMSFRLMWSTLSF